MPKRLWILFWGAALLASAETDRAAPISRYHFYDVGTLGGTLSLFYNFDQLNFTPRPLNDRGQLAGTSLTTFGYAAGYLWSHGTLRPLPDLPNANALGGGSNANGINEWGIVVGAGDNGELNPLNGQPYDHAVVWIGSKIFRLPELDGHESWANFIDDQGLIAGYANNAVPDPYTYAGTQTRAVIWRRGHIQSLGTLGGTDSAAFAVNPCAAEGEYFEERKKEVVMGTSSLNTLPGPPFGIPQTDAFLWSDGVLKDLGGLGGGFSIPSAINCKGDVTVISFDASNQHFQSFVSGKNGRTALQQLGGSFVEAVDLNNSGRVVGAVSDASDATSLAAIWGPSGEGELLGTIGSDSGSIALGINRSGVVVGGSGVVTFSSAANYSHAFVWQRGTGLQDLNTLIAAGASLTLNVAYAVNDEGIIAGLGTTASGETHAFALMPDYERHDEVFHSAAYVAAAPGSSVRMSSPMERLMRSAQLRPAMR